MRGQLCSGQCWPHLKKASRPIVCATHRMSPVQLTWQEVTDFQRLPSPIQTPAHRVGQRAGKETEAGASG